MEVRDGTRDPWGGPGQIVGLLNRFGTGWESVREVRDGSGGFRGGPRQIVGLLNRSGTGWGSVREVWDGSGNLGEVLDG